MQMETDRQDQGQVAFAPSVSTITSRLRCKGGRNTLICSHTVGGAAKNVKKSLPSSPNSTWILLP